MGRNSNPFGWKCVSSLHLLAGVFFDMFDGKTIVAHAVVSSFTEVADSGCYVTTNFGPLMLTVLAA